MKRTLTIISILILFILLIGGGLFFFARNKATKSGVTPPTFKEFIGIGTTVKQPLSQNKPDTTSSDFTSTDTETTPGSTGPTVVTKTSVFTNSNIAPTGTTPSDVSINDTQSSGGNTSTQGGTGIVVGGLSTTTAPMCSDEDTNITFTPQEIARLDALKNRFYAIAETLYTDNDVATEASNYDTFKSKLSKINELYTYCVNSPVYTNATATTVTAQPYGTVVPGTNTTINYRVPTPFWRDPTKDNQAFVHQGSNWQGIFSDPDVIFPERSIEHALRINLW